MAKKSLLLVDADPRSLRVLEVSLRKAGYSVATCRDAQNALETVDLSEPDLILSDTRLPGMNGFELVEELRRRVEHQGVPFMFLSSDGSVESKVRGLELGVEDYLVKPIYIKEIITRINLTLQRQEREGLARRTSISKTRFTGSLGDMGLVDLLQTVEISRKSGVLELSNGADRGTVTFRDGQLVDAEMGRLRGDAAIYRLLLWSEGEFEIDFRPVRAEQRITSSTQALLMEGMRRIDEWGRLLEQIPSVDNVFDVSEEELVERLAEIPDEINSILRQIDGRRSLMQVVDACDGDDLETLTAITKLYFEGIIFPTGRTAGAEEDRLLDEEVVPGESQPVSETSALDASEDDGAEPALVPRAPTEPPPSASQLAALTDRAIANAVDPGPSPDVSRRAEVTVPRPAQVSKDQDDPSAGTDSALGLGAVEPDAGEQARSDLEGASDLEAALDPDAASNPAAALHPGAATDDESLEPEAPQDEDGMAKKGRRRRQMRAKAAREEQGQQVEQESANNVIQFPAQAKRTLSSSQVAVNDDVGVSTIDETVVEPAQARVREDETQPRTKPEEESAASAGSDAHEAEQQPILAPEPRAVPEAKSVVEAAQSPAAQSPTLESKPEPQSEATLSEAPVEAKAEPQPEPHAPDAPEVSAPEASAPEASAPEASASEAQAAASVEPDRASARPGAREQHAGGGKKKKKKKHKGQQRGSAPPAKADAAQSQVPKSDAPKSEAPKSEPPKSDAKSEAPKSEPARPELDPTPTASAAPAPRREKKTSTTSAEIRAVSSTGEHQAVAEDFFRASDGIHKVDQETWDDLQKEALPISPGMKRAKQATFAILAAGLALIGGFLIYSNFLMPRPAVLSGATRPPELPEGFAADDSTPAEPEPEPEAAADPATAPQTEPTEAEPTEAGPTEAGPTEAEPTEAEPSEVAQAEPTQAEPAAAVAAEPVAEPVAAEEPAAEPPAAAQPAAPAEGEDAAALAQQAFRALNRGRNDDAAGLAQRAVTADQTSALGWLVLGAARQGLRDAAGARAAYQSCVEHGADTRHVRECRMMLR